MSIAPFPGGAISTGNSEAAPTREKDGPITFTAARFVPVSQLVQRYGVKAIIYGGPGTGKTPLMMTAPNACHGFSEPGLLSVRSHNQPATIIDTWKLIYDYIRWCTESTEARLYETKCFDSISQMAEIILAEEQVHNRKDPRADYGELSKKMMKIMNKIFFAPNMNAVMIAKQGRSEHDGMSKDRPYFPGKDLNIKIPHLFDSVWRIEEIIHEGKPMRVFRTRENNTCFARERSGNLAELEYADLSYVINKSKQ